MALRAGTRAGGAASASRAGLPIVASASHTAAAAFSGRAAAAASCARAAASAPASRRLLAGAALSAAASRPARAGRRTAVAAFAEQGKPWKTRDARLVLENGTVWTGVSFGAKGTQVGEVVFNTSFTGYQEIMTDPSYKGQFVAFTHPHIGNVGINFGARPRRRRRPRRARAFRCR